MASLSQVNIDIKFNGLENLDQATKKMRQVQSEVKRLAQEERAGAISTDQYTKRVGQLASELQSATRGKIQARNAVNQYSREIRQAVSAQEQFANTKAIERRDSAERKALRDYLRYQREKEIAAQREARIQERAAEQSIAAQQRLSNEMDQLRARYNPLAAASQRYEQELNQLNRAKQLGVVNAQQYETALEQLNLELANGATRMGGMNTANGAMRQGMSRMSVAVQQTGYQVGDFLVQVQSGTNAFVAFGQQATQLAGLLTLSMNPKLVVLGAVLSIAIPLATALGAAFMRTRMDTDEAAGGIQSFEDRLKSARSEIANITLDIDRMNEGFATTAEQTLAQNVNLARQNVRQAELALQGATLRGDRGRGITISQAERDLEIARENLRISEEELRVARERTREQERLNQLQDRRAFFAEQTAEMQNQTRLYQTIAQFGEESAQVEAERTRQAREAFQLEVMREGIYGQMLVDLMAQYDAMEDSRRAAEAIANTDMDSGIAAAASSAAQLARNMGISVSAASALMAMGGGRQEVIFDPRDPRYNRDRALMEQIRSETVSIDSWSPPEIEGISGGGGGTGAGAAEDIFTSRIEGIRELQAAIEAAQQETALFEQEVSLLDSALKNGLITQQQYNQLLREAQDAYGQASTGAYDYQSALDKVSKTAQSSMEDAFMSIIDGSKSASDAFRDMARQILAEAIRMLIIRPMINNLFGAFGFANGGVFSGGSVIPSANGNAFSNGNVIPFANGGVVNSPTFFPMRGNQTGLMGEAGPEAIMPLKRGKDGKLGVAAEGGGGETIVINQSFNFSANGDESVKRIIASEAPKIAALTQRQIVDQRRRGGAMKGAFG